jgi:L-asparagine oxygenase
LVRNVPLGQVPPTPGQARPRRPATGEAAAAMSVLLAGLGEQHGFRPEFGGRIIQDILPVRGFETEQISLGSTVDLELHVEMAFSRYRSDYVALLCLREDHNGVAGTTISSIDSMLPTLDAAAIRTLRQPRFRTKVDASFRAGDDLPGDEWVDPICVLDGPPERPHLRVDFAETEGTDQTAQVALRALRAAADRTRIVVQLRAGDLLVIDNHRALHGRTPFMPRYDGADRWLLRSFVAKDLRRSERVRKADARIVEADYLARRAGSGEASTGDLSQYLDHPIGA